MKEIRIGFGNPIIGFLVDVGWIDAADIVRAKNVPVHDLDPFFEWRVHLARDSRAGTPVPRLSTGPGVVSQRGFVAEYRSRPHQRRPANVTAATNNRVLDQGRGAYARVTPDHGVFNPRALFNITTTPQNRVDYFDARFDRAFVRDY